jgi:hypothetical protein
MTDTSEQASGFLARIARRAEELGLGEGEPQIAEWPEVEEEGEAEMAEARAARERDLPVGDRSEA